MDGSYTDVITEWMRWKEHAARTNYTGEESDNYDPETEGDTESYKVSLGQVWLPPGDSEFLSTTKVTGRAEIQTSDILGLTDI